MNQTQIKYARERATTIYKKHVAALNVKHTIESKHLSCDEKLKALKAGRFTLPRKAANSLRYWHSQVSFTDEVVGGLDTKAYNTAKSTLDTAYTKLIDELVLGDNELALQLLKDFEAI